MRQTAKPHPTDVRDQGYIAEAIYFTAFCQRGPHDRRRVQVDVTDDCDRDMALAAAKAKGQQLANEMGKAALVYAVTAAGRSAHIGSIYPEAVGGPTTMTKSATTTPTAYASKSAATKAARLALGDGARFTTDKGPTGWTFAPMADGEAYAAAVDATDAAEAASAIFGEADDKAGADEAMAAVPADFVQARDIGGHIVMTCPNDPLLVGGVKYPNKAQAGEARRLAAAKAARPAKAPKAGPVQKAARKAAPAAKKAVAAAVAKVAAPAAGKRAQVLADAQAGKLPPVPDFSAETHKRYRGQLAAVVDMVKAGNVKGLQAEQIKTSGSTGKALDRYRQLAVTALEAKAGG